jgi:hypothetical protein
LPSFFKSRTNVSLVLADVEAAAETSAIKGLLWLFRFGCVAAEL